MQVLLAATRAAQPWRNGGGVTFPVTAEPHHADAGGEFDWRVSIAEIAEDGGFSTFPGVDRQITIVSGDGVDLTVDGQVHALRADVVVPFRGESAAAARLVGGPTLDLNLMTRRGAVAGSLRVEQLTDVGPVIGGGVGVTILVVVTGSVSCGGTRLNPLDAIRLDPGDASLRVSGDARVAVIEISGRN